jgi:GAF domain-containing protein
VETERRWPAWTEAVMALGVRSVLSTPMVAGGTAIGAVKVYSYQRHAYDQDSQELLALFARQAAILLENAQSYQDAHQLTAQLKAAMTSRDLIGQAKGILIAQGAPDEQAAFAMLVTASQRTNTKVREVAEQLITDTASGQWPGRDRPQPSS